MNVFSQSWCFAFLRPCCSDSFLYLKNVKTTVLFLIFVSNWSRNFYLHLYLIIYIYQVWFPRLLRKLITIHSFIESDRTKIYPIQFLKVYWLVETFSNVDFWLHEVIISMLDSNSHKTIWLFLLSHALIYTNNDLVIATFYDQFIRLVKERFRYKQ